MLSKDKEIREEVQKLDTILIFVKPEKKIKSRRKSYIKWSKFDMSVRYELCLKIKDSVYYDKYELKRVLFALHKIKNNWISYKVRISWYEWDGKKLKQVFHTVKQVDYRRDRFLEIEPDVFLLVNNKIWIITFELFDVEKSQVDNSNNIIFNMELADFHTDPLIEMRLRLNKVGSEINTEQICYSSNYQRCPADVQMVLTKIVPE